MTKKTPWLSFWDGKFKISTCRTAESYIESRTGIRPKVHKTERYLVINFPRNGALDTFKIECIVLYCLHESDFEPLFEYMKPKVSVSLPLDGIAVWVITKKVPLVRMRVVCGRVLMAVLLADKENNSHEVLETYAKGINCDPKELEIALCPVEVLGGSIANK